MNAFPARWPGQAAVVDASSDEARPPAARPAWQAAGGAAQLPGPALLRTALLCLVVACSWRSAVADTLSAGFGAADITPAIVDDAPVWLAGYGTGRRATGIHDRLWARCVVLDDGQTKLALVSVDLVGLQYPAVQRIRAALPELDHVLVASTHNHEAPDVIGIWGRSLAHRGVDDRYEQLVIDRTVAAVRQAASRTAVVSAEYGLAKDESLLRDSRQPIAKDGVLRLLKFTRVASGEAAGIVLQWNCHPEALGSRNTLITADFPAATIAHLAAHYRCPVVYFSGALGGLMAPPRERIRGADGSFLDDGTFDYAQRYGDEVAHLARRAGQAATPIRLVPLAIAAKPITIPLENPLYQAARSLGVLRRPARVWTGDFEVLGPPLTAANADQQPAVETEVGYLRLGELHVACIPGELYPELVYGKFQEPVDPSADFPDAPLETTVTATLPGDKWLLLGLANDEIGYIIPRRQWDQRPPFAYGRATSQYGEINSCGSHIAPIIMQALANRVGELAAAGRR